MTAETALGDAPDTAYRWAVLGGVWLVYFCFGLTTASMAPLVAPITAELGIGYAAMGAILGAWPLVYIAAAVPCGMLLDRLGTRVALMLAALIIAASGVARGLAGNELALFAAVGLFGIGGPLISIGAPKLIAQWFEGPSRGTAMGLYITGPSLGGIAALSLTNGVLMPLTGQDWRMVLFLYAGFAVACGVVWLAIASHPLARAADSRPAEGKKFDLAAFAGILRLGQVRLVLAMSIGIFFFNHGLNNWLPEILRSRGLSPALAGYWASLPTVVGVIGALIIPRLATPDRRQRVMALLFGAALISSLLLHAMPGPWLAVGLILQGVARSSMMTVAILLLMETPGVPKARLGLAGGLFFTTAEIGGVLGPLTLGALSDLTGGFAMPIAATSVVCVILLGLIALLGRARTA
ncbi:MAG TPA: MFS transporter [Thermohalobaculum sp.]|nr:MFS transporter [Thermohalobaculum sp.]